MRSPRFDILSVDAIVADERVSHGNNLAFVGRIGQNLLVARHRSIEANLPAGGAARAKTCAVKQGPVFQCQNCFHSRIETALRWYPSRKCGQPLEAPRSGEEKRPAPPSRSGDGSSLALFHERLPTGT